MAIYDVNGNRIDGGGAGGSAFRTKAYLYKLKNLNDQGICTDGTYIYSTDGSNLRKYGILDKSSTSAEVSYNHGNDMTYNPQTGYLYVATMSSGQGIAVADASTLEHIEYIDIKDGSNTSVSASQVAYDRINDRYIVGVGSMFYIYDNEFNYVSSFDGKHGGTHQGIETDGTYIYKCRSGVSGRGIVQVIDFDGGTVAQIDVTSNELESITWDWSENWYCNTKNSQGLYYTSLITAVGLDAVAQLHKILDAYGA